MKKISYIFLSLTLLIVFSSGIYAEDASPSTVIKIKELKDKLASRVAELNLVSKRVFYGEIKTLSDQKIIISQAGNEININLDDNTTLAQQDSGGKKKNIKVDSLKTGQSIYSWGTFNSSTNTLSASNVSVVENPAVIIGTIKSVDKKNYQLTVTSDNKDILVDHDYSTKDLIWENNKDLNKGGFSKFAENQVIYIYGYNTTDKNGKDMVSAQRLIILSSK